MNKIIAGIICLVCFSGCLFLTIVFPFLANFLSGIFMGVLASMLYHRLTDNE